MLREFKDSQFHYFISEHGYHGEYKSWYTNGSQCTHCFFINNICHGEFKTWNFSGRMEYHFFYVNGKEVSFNEIPYPKTPEDRMYFMLKYNLQLLPVETVC